MSCHNSTISKVRYRLRLASWMVWESRISAAFGETKNMLRDYDYYSQGRVEIRG